MDETLPGTVRLRLQRALEQWRRWVPRPACAPEPGEILTGGRSNTSVRVSAADVDWVVRIDGVDPVRLGLNRSAEWRCLVVAARARLAPRPVYRNPELGVLVCEYHAPRPAPESADALEAIASLLRQIHRLPRIHYRLDPMARARRYLELAGHRDMPPTLVQALERLQAEPVVPCLCHNDLLGANRLRSADGLLALDWEYAAMGDPLFDLAAIIEGDCLDNAAAQALHRHWLQRSPDAGEAERLADQRGVYRALSELWEQANRRQQ
jgi:aminoglycoside phosphotransferase (APT) family kinase protein